MQKIAILIILFLSVSVFAQVNYQEIFNSWDSNRDGRITSQEFPGNPVHFNEIDRNNDRFITLEELGFFLDADGVSTPPTPPTPPTPHNQQQVNQLQQQVNQLQQQIAQLNQNLQVRDNTIRELEMKLRNTQNTQPNTQIQQQILQLQQQNSQLQQQIAQQNQVLQTKENAIRELEINLRNVQSQSNSAQINQMLQTIEQLKRDIQTRDQTIQAQNKRIQELEKSGGKKPQKDMMDEKNVVLLSNLMSAREYARVDAYDMLAKQISGHWIAASSKNVDGENQLKIISKVPPTALFMVDIVDDGSDTVNGLIRLKAVIKRENAIESIRKTKEMNKQPFTYEDYQELRMMLPEVITSIGYGAYKAPAQKMLLAAQGARLDAKRKLIEKLRGVTVQGSTRLENFVVQEHEVSVTIQNTWLIGVQIVDEQVIDKVMVQSVIEMSRANFIYSIRLGLEKMNLKMTPDEYQNLRNMLPDATYKMAGEAAIE